MEVSLILGLQPTFRNSSFSTTYQWFWNFLIQKIIGIVRRKCKLVNWKNRFHNRILQEGPNLWSKSWLEGKGCKFLNCMHPFLRLSSVWQYSYEWMEKLPLCSLGGSVRNNSCCHALLNENHESWLNKSPENHQVNWLIDHKGPRDAVSQGLPDVHQRNSRSNS